MTEDLEARIKALEEQNKALEEKLTPKYPKISSIQASGDLKETLDTFRTEGRKETFEDLIWKQIIEAEKVPGLENRIKELEKENKKLNGD